MKIRNGFVTNSSSSSFIVAAKTNNDKTLAVVLDAISKNCDGYETCEGRIIGSVEELNGYYIKNFDDRALTIKDILKENEYLEEYYNKMKDYIEKGYVILVKEIGYSDNAMKVLIYELNKKIEDFVIIENDF